jgi:hypothetical protein
MASRGTVRFSGKVMLREVISFHVIPCDFKDADGQWEKFVSQHCSEEKEFATLKCIDSAHRAGCCS